MVRYRPRRAQRAPFTLRAARITVPAVVIGALVAGVTATAWPQPSALTAVPVTSASPAADAIRAVPNQAARGGDRPAPSVDPAAAKAAKKAAEKAEEAAKDRARALAKAEAKRAKAARIAKKKAEEARAEKARAERARIARAKARAAQAAEIARLRRLDLNVEGTRYTTTGLNIRTLPDSGANVLGVLKTGSKVSITDSVEDGFRLIVRDGKGRWVKNQYLSKKKPAPPKRKSSSSSSSSGISSARCNKSRSIEGGLQSNGVKVYRALCARFPNISSFGGRRPANGGFHPSGRAVDAMIDSNNGGWEVARWLRANAGRLGVSEVIHAQKIWTVQRSGEGWRSMSDGGSATANHYDHVHVSVY